MRAPAGWGAPLLRPMGPHGVDRARGELTLLVQDDGGPWAWLSAFRPGDRAEISGPVGSPLSSDPRSRSLLLIGEGSGVALLRPVAVDALAAGKRVALLSGTPSASRVYPSSLLPDEVEYVVATRDGSLGHAGSVVELVPGYEAWADQALAAGPPAMLAQLAHLAAGRDARLGVARLGRRSGRSARNLHRSRRRSWLDVLLQPEVGCALGVCLGCVVMGIAGPVRPCREGPSFAAHDLTWADPT